MAINWDCSSYKCIAWFQNTYITLQRQVVFYGAFIVIIFVFF